MFGKKQKLKTQTAFEDNVIHDAPPEELYDDELPGWKRLSDIQLVQKWYQLELLSSDVEETCGNTLEWFQESAHKGNRSSQYTLGKMFYRGILTPPNIFQAGIWYSKASVGGSPFASYELAKMCAAGISMNKDKEMADKLFQIAYRSFLEFEVSSPNPAIEKKLR